MIVLSDPTLSNEAADANVLQIVINLTSQRCEGEMVAELREEDNENLMRLIKQETSSISTVISHNLIGRLMVVFCRFPGAPRAASQAPRVQPPPPLSSAPAAGPSRARHVTL